MKILLVQNSNDSNVYDLVIEDPNLTRRYVCGLFSYRMVCFLLAEKFADDEREIEIEIKRKETPE